MLYRLHFSDVDGRSAEASRERLPEIIEEAQVFADTVGDYSECGMRVSVDFTDGGQYNRYTRIPAGYDARVTARPSRGEAYAGLAYSWGEIHIPLGGSSRAVPSDHLLLHEWLHLAVFHYRQFDGVTWPQGDVHASAEHGYGGTASGTPEYFRAMMSGRVSENGRLVGMRREQWLSLPTPVALEQQRQAEEDAEEAEDDFEARYPYLRFRTVKQSGRRLRLTYRAPGALAGRRATFTAVRYRHLPGRGWRRAARSVRHLTLRRNGRLHLAPPRRGQELRMTLKTVRIPGQPTREATLVLPIG